MSGGVSDTPLLSPATVPPVISAPRYMEPTITVTEAPKGVSEMSNEEMLSKIGIIIAVMLSVCILFTLMMVMIYKRCLSPAAKRRLAEKALASSSPDEKDLGDANSTASDSSGTV